MPDDDVRPPEQPLGAVEVAGGDRARGCPSSARAAPSRVNCGDDLDVVAELAPERGDGLRRAARARSRRPNRASSGSPRGRRDRRCGGRTRRTASRAGRRRRSGRPSPRRRPPRAAPGARRDRTAAAAPRPCRISSGWWSKVITGGPRVVGRRGLATSCVEQVVVAAMEPVEHADDDEQAPERRRRARRCPVDATRHRPAVSSTGRIFVGAIRVPSRRPMPDDRARRHRRGAAAMPSGVAAHARPRDGRTGPGRHRRSRPSSARPPGCASSPVSDGSRRRADARPGRPRPRRRGSSSSEWAPSSANGPLAVAYRAPRYAPVPSRSPRSRASARTYVPAEQRTSTMAIGRAGSRSSHSRRSSGLDLDAPRRQVRRLARARHGVGPPAADLDRRVRGRPLELRRRGTPRARPSTCSRVGAGAVDGRQLAVEVVGRRRRAEADRGPVRLVVARGGTRRAASRRPRNSGRTPEANGSSVPPWPIRRVAASRRTSATTSCDVGPAGLATTRTPCIPGASGCRGTALRPRAGRRDRVARGARPRRAPGARASAQRRVDRRAGGAGVPATAERAGQDGRVDAAGLRPDRDAASTSGPASLNRIATSAVSDCARRSMRPSECEAERAGGRQVGVGQRAVDDPPAVADLEPVQHATEEPQLRVGLGAVEPARDLRQRRARRDQRRRDGERPRRRVRVGEGRGVHDDAGHQRRGQRAAGRRRAGRPSRAASSATISHVAAAAGSTQSRGPPSVVRGVVVDEHARQPVEQLRDGGRGPHRGGRASRSRRRRAGRSRRPASGSVHEAVHARRGSRTAAARGRSRRASRGRRGARRSTATPSAAPERVRVGVLVARRSRACRAAAIALGRGRRDGVEPRAAGRRSRRPRPLPIAAHGRSRSARLARRAAAATGLERLASSACRDRRASAATPRSAARRRRLPPASSSASSWSTRVPRCGGVVGAEWSSGMRRSRIRAAQLVAHERHRVLERRASSSSARPAGR